MKHCYQESINEYTIIENVHIELLVTVDVLKTCSICVILYTYLTYLLSCLFDMVDVLPTLLRVEGYRMGCAPGIS